MNNKTIVLALASALISISGLSAEIDRTQFTQLTDPNGAFRIVSMVAEHGTDGIDRVAACDLLCELEKATHALEAFGDDLYVQEQELFEAAQVPLPAYENFIIYNAVAAFIAEEFLPARKALLRAKIQLKQRMGLDQADVLRELASTLPTIEPRVRAEYRRLRPDKIDQPAQEVAAAPAVSFAARLIALAKSGKVQADKQPQI